MEKLSVQRCKCGGESKINMTTEDGKQKLFLLRAWQVLVDDQGGFGRFMSAFDTYVLNMQDPEQDVVAWKPEIIRMSEDADLLPVLLEAYQDAQLETRRLLSIGELIQRLEEQTGETWVRQPHHNGMMQLSNELADAKAALRRLSAYARAHAGDIQYTGDHPIAVAEKLAGRELSGNTEQLDTAQAQFESLAGEPVSVRYKLRDAVETIRKSGIDIDAEKTQAERDSLNYPEIPEGYALVPIEPTEAMMLHKSECKHHAWNDHDCPMRQTRRLVWAYMIEAAQGVKP